jgi:hypothetical protein
LGATFAREGKIVSLAILNCRAQYGTSAPPVTIEVFLSGGLPAFTIVGMAETAVRESKDRVRGALLSSGFEFPQQRITVSLAPAEMKKSGGRYDLAIALGILAAKKQFPKEALDGVEVYGELSLNGELRSVPAILPAALSAATAGRKIIVPTDNEAEASIACANVYPANSLTEVASHLAGREAIEPVDNLRLVSVDSTSNDIKDVRGQRHAKRALEIAAAGLKLCKPLPSILFSACRSQSIPGGNDHFEAHITLRRLPRWSVVVVARGPARFRAHTMAYYFLMNSRSLIAGRWKSCANHWRRAASVLRERKDKRSIPRNFS